MMKNESISNNFEDPKKEFSYRDLFRIFVQRRKIKLLRYLFQLHNDFDFSPQLFIEALELEAYDIGALLYREFFRSLRDRKETPTENEYIITILISSLNKNNGLVEFKTFLLRSYIEQFALRHAKQLVDVLDQKIMQENKFNILALNFNTVKTSCLLIELVETAATRFEQLRVRCNTIRSKIEDLTRQYMQKVDTE